MTDYSIDDGDGSGPTKAQSALPHVKNTTLLEQLTEKLAEDVQIPLVEIEVKHRRDPDLSVQFSPNIRSHELKFWRQKSTRKQELDNVKFSTYVLGGTCHAILLDGEVVEDEDGNAVVFNSPVFADMMDVSMSQIIPDGIQQFFGVDSYLEATALAILEAAGYNDAADVEDPTTAS
jgi:hypothetical protein